MCRQHTGVHWGTREGAVCATMVGLCCGAAATPVPRCLPGLGLLSALLLPREFWVTEIFFVWSFASRAVGAVSVSKGTAVLARQCRSGKKIVRNCLNTRLLEEERKTIFFLHKVRFKMLFQPFSAGKITIDLQGLKTVGLRCNLRCVLLISGIFSFSSPTDLPNK